MAKGNSGLNAPCCRVCDGRLRVCVDFGSQALANALVAPGDDRREEFLYRLALGMCENCTLVQLVEEVPRGLMFRDDYPFYSSGSAVMAGHFAAVARRFLERELTGPDAFVVEIGSNDGIMLDTVRAAGVRHLGVDPSRRVCEVAAAKGVRHLNDFFEKSSAVEIAAAEGQADVIFSANTFSHLPYLDSVFEGITALLKPDGVFVFEDPYLGDIMERTSFDQIYDEHFYFFTARSARAMARRYGFELVDVEHLGVHGGEVRYTLTFAGSRRPGPAVAEMIAAEEAAGLHRPEVLAQFERRMQRTRDELLTLLRTLRDQGRTVMAYGATGKSTTVANYCGIGPDLVSCVIDNTPAKQGMLTPGTHIPIRSPQVFREAYPDYALLFAWNHAEEIMAKERGFTESGGQWILYIPQVHLV
ncbi:class I SAM-dependent methyltransferase [Streptacidiphilus sp. PB12-B1b]|uniref:class I SAM-dependent methyltransferase n=1 Tax=Streptacidiphilus sp. PB12-B1b TaxID=2705012 RepID=UPI0015FAFA52|nr:class I SAM-dependent methyltransferase [Streptacidiphilus sp. PB12-B1b]QMU77748.1 class I SAM-dependent methyltransferase [Streptacidiphilus sp. PB12-B1b]